MPPSPFATRTLSAALLVVAAARLGAQAPAKPTIEQFLGEPSPLQIATARSADRIAWNTYEKGMRNVYTAAAPSFAPVRLTSWLKDDGIEVSNVKLSDDGSIAVFVRGSAPNSRGWIANPTHDPAGTEEAIWAVRTSGGAPWRVAEGAAPELSPNGRYVLFVKEGQIYRGTVVRTGPVTQMDTGGIPFIKEWGRQSNPRWSPDGSKISFVTDRDNHAFIGIYDVATRRVDYLAPSVDCDGSPTWSPDSKRVAFIRRPGVPFGMQSQEGNGGIGNPTGPAAGRGGRGCAAGFGGRGGGRGAPDDTAGANRTPLRNVPGLYRATFPGGYTTSIMVVDVAQCLAQFGGCKPTELWHNQANDRTFANVNNIQWAGDHLIFPMAPPGDEWDRYYSISISNPQQTPVLLTTTNGLIEGPTSASLSKDGKTLYYCTNAEDIERRHIWAVPTAGGTPRQLSSGEGIETFPLPLSSGKQIATLYFDARTPASVGLIPTEGGAKAKLIYPTLPRDFPVAAHVVPQIVHTKAADGLDISNQLFLPADLKPGERRPAIVFVHGGPIRQMLPGYHYMEFYHWAYGFNQWLANQGYVVMSINYRRGIGYGRSFQNAPNAQGAGNSEYQDVVAGAKYLQGRPDVDPARVGIWGLSYGGLLTSQALARNSDIFVAGVDLAGVHLYGNVLDTANLAYRSSAISAVDNWKSPVLLVQGDDDRNVDFAQTVGLVQLLRARGVYHELIVVPDDLHESQLHSRWMYTWNRMGDFLHRFVWEKQTATMTGQGQGR